MTLTADELARYARHIVLPEVGGAGQLRLRRARVVVIGAGGIGSPVLHYLGAAGVGHLDVVDDDRVDASNLQRQTLYTTADLGTYKAAAAAAAVARLNPHVSVRPLMRRIGAANAASLLDGADAVIDGSDNFDTRLAVADAALALRVPLISAAVGRFEGQIGVFRGWERDRPCYRCFVGGAPQRDGLTCAEEGVLGPVTGVVGSLAALEVIRQLAPFGDDSAGKLVLIDLLALRFRTLSLPKDPGCPACGTDAG
ncbi:molybdopterin-synthase adenylyltransferase MoeB [Sphingomonas sp. BK580]|uniref:HesA/MoeB/ThiF family protein n=1 Tax=Sphingomonas sp. BK580 TaxID=2586972 RepID=UPI00160C469E|nr:molybdopterin-synthase adenylyltransferase MoeB [Sphingomonas sp. BK580]MBB3695537.1 adenylyltransferase/sulfurtransferase [Sphingomonas sp. BK580]